MDSCPTASTYDALPRDLVDYARRLHRELLGARIAILLLRNGQPSTDLPADAIGSIVAFVFKRSLAEDRSNPPITSYSQLLRCLRGPDAVSALDYAIEVRNSTCISITPHEFHVPRDRLFPLYLATTESPCVILLDRLCWNLVPPLMPWISPGDG